MDTPAVRILASSLVLEERHDQRLTDARVRVDEERPRWVDDVYSIHTLLRVSVFNFERRNIVTHGIFHLCHSPADEILARI